MPLSYLSCIIRLRNFNQRDKFLNLIYVNGLLNSFFFDVIRYSKRPLKKKSKKKKEKGEKNERGINCNKRTDIEEKCKGLLSEILDCATHEKATRLGLQGLVYARNSARNAAYRKLVIITRDSPLVDAWICELELVRS